MSQKRWLKGLPALLLVGSLALLGRQATPAHAAPARPQQAQTVTNIFGVGIEHPSATTCPQPQVPGGPAWGSRWYAYTVAPSKLPQLGGPNSLVVVNEDAPSQATPAHYYVPTTSTNQAIYTDHAPAIACFQGHLWLAYTDKTTSQIWLGYFDPNTCWDVPSNCQLWMPGRIPWQQGNSYQFSAFGPALAVSADEQTLYCAWHGGSGNNYLYIDSAVMGPRALSWLNNNPPPLSDTSLYAPALTDSSAFVNEGNKDGIWIAWTGTDTPHHLWFGEYQGTGMPLLHHTGILSQWTNEALGFSADTPSSAIFDFAWQSASYDGIVSGYWVSNNFVATGAVSGTHSVGAPAGPYLLGLNCYYNNAPTNDPDGDTDNEEVYI